MPEVERIKGRRLDFIWIIDCSGSMSQQGKMQSLNAAIRESIPAMKDVAEQNPFAEMLVRTVSFSNGAKWHDAKPTPVNDFQWHDLEADGVTDMGAALKLVASELTAETMGTHGFPPVLVLVTDGMPTDDYKQGIAAVMKSPWGKRAARIGIAIGSDAEHAPLEEFIGPNLAELPVLHASNAQSLTAYIKWASASVSQSVAAGGSEGPKSSGSAPAADAADKWVVAPPPEPAAAPSAAGVAAGTDDNWVGWD